MRLTAVKEQSCQGPAQTLLNSLRMVMRKRVAQHTNECSSFSLPSAELDPFFTWFFLPEQATTSTIGTKGGTKVFDVLRVTFLSLSPPTEGGSGLYVRTYALTPNTLPTYEFLCRPYTGRKYAGTFYSGIYLLYAWHSFHNRTVGQKNVWARTK